MKTVLITGANGFIGKNLLASLAKEDVQILTYDVDNKSDDLRKFTEQADFIFHLAGVNRPRKESEFARGNKEFTESLLDILKKKKKCNTAAYDLIHSS